MQYRINPKNGDQLSALGFGCMRFGRDEAQTERQILSALDQGVNYFDTAYIYPGSEATLGRILSKGHRHRAKIATKLPPYLVRKTADFDKILGTQLARLQTDYIDYYFIHMLPNVAEWKRLVSLGILDWLAQKRASGQIRNIGFSYHGGYAPFEALIDAYDWGFCMLQYNYFDENNQAGKQGLLYAAEKGVPVMVMEPLRGGKLVNLPAEARQVFAGADGSRSPAEWGLRWVWNHPQVLCVVSGMNSQAMVDENIRIAAGALPGTLTADELALYGEVNRILRAQAFVPCTGCGYCVPCPQGVDIPLCFSSYNDLSLTSKPRARVQYILRTDGHNASRCNSCGACVKKCPQAINIPAEMARVKGAMERFPYRPARFVVRKVMRLKAE